MSVLNDEFLRDLLLETAATFEIPPAGKDEIARRAGDDESASPTVEQITFDIGSVGATPPRRTVGGTIRAHRLLSVAACLVVVAAITAGGLAFGNKTPVASRSSVALGRTVPSTTLPISHGAGALSPATPSPQVFGTAQSPNSSSAAPLSTGTSKNVATSGPAATSNSASTSQSSKIEETGSLTLQVGKGDLSSTITKLSALAASKGGFVANSQTLSKAASHGSPPSGSITLQVPVATFSAVVKDAQAYGKNLQLSTKATDVTGQYVNLQSQITALQASLQQYMTIMTKAQSISDILAVQAQIQSLQSQIQQLQGQLSVLTNETSYSTLTVTVRERGTLHHRHVAHHPSGIDRAWDNSVKGFIDGVEGIIAFAGPALFALLLAGVVLLGGRQLWRRWQRHNL
jgi:hypothetical protein